MFFKNSQNIKTKTLRRIINLFNLTLVGLIIYYTIIFYLEKPILILSNLIIFSSIIALFLKLLFWYKIKNSLSIPINNNKHSKKILIRIAFCISTYLTPAYYIFMQKNLVMKNDIILITLIIIILISIIGIIIERYLLSAEYYQL